MIAASLPSTSPSSVPWWRDAVVYQVYPRSFSDSNGDGEGDLRGITERIGYLADLGVDALWICPFYPSPQVDGGYDVADYCDVDPRFGTLADLDDLVGAAHARGIRVTIDLVPNHCSDQHPWFAEAVAAGRGSAARELFHFREGQGPDGDEPPNGWRSVFGGPSWTRVTEPDGTPGQWYYHLFAREQPDFSWDHPAVLAEFERILAFWLDRGIDGFRIDVSDALIKDTAWPETPDGSPVIPKGDDGGPHHVYRAFRRLMDAYPGDRMAVVETGAPDDVVALFVRPDEMHLAFNFTFVHAGWSAQGIRTAIEGSLAANAQVGAPTTWVTDNHDTPRSVTRYAEGVVLEGAYVPTATAAAEPVDAGLGGAGDATDRVPASSADLIALGTRRARAMAVVLLSLPGAAFVYAGQELGLPNVDDLPLDVLQDPAVARSGGTIRGRDGCRVPLPWSGDDSPFGFTRDDATPWLPMPDAWRDLTVEAQAADDASMLSLYRRLTAVRRAEPSMRRGTVDVEVADDVLRLIRRSPEGADLVVVLNLRAAPVPLPDGDLLVTSATDAPAGVLPGECAAVVRLP